MIIKFIKKGNRNQLVCLREDDSVEIADLGPQLPFHDLAHYVVENQMQLSSGFWGNIQKGYSVKQLSNKEIIKTLPAESMISEIVTRALQSLDTNACTCGQFNQLIEEELDALNIDHPFDWNQTTIQLVLQEFRTLLRQWDELPEGGTLELQFSIGSKK